jgi:hypothetical protein
LQVGAIVTKDQYKFRIFNALVSPQLVLSHVIPASICGSKQLELNLAAAEANPLGSFRLRGPITCEQIPDFRELAKAILVLGTVLVAVGQSWLDQQIGKLSAQTARQLCEVTCSAIISPQFVAGKSYSSCLVQTRQSPNHNLNLLSRCVFK